MDHSEMRELLIGTWTGTALIIDMLVEDGAVERQNVIDRLSEAEALAKDRRGLAISALRRLIEKQFDSQQKASLPACGFVGAAEPVAVHKPLCGRGRTRTARSCHR